MPAAARPSPENTLTLHLAQAPAAQVGAQPAMPLPPLDGLMLAWLALNGPTAREHLAHLLWPSSETGVARNALRQRLFRLRRQLGVEACTGGDVITLAPDVRHDLADATALLGEWPGPEAGELAHWLANQREQLRHRRAQQLAQHIETHEAQGEWPQALALAEQLLALDPLSEEAHRHLMRLHYLRGDKAEALQAFDRCEQMLKHEIGAQPSPATMQLLRSIEGAEPEPTPTASARARHLPACLTRPPRLIGRDEELATLRSAWSTGQLVIVTGEAGMGKSRLLQAMMTSEPGPFVQAAARPGDALVAYASIARLLRAMPDRPPLELHAALAPALPELAPAVRTGHIGSVAQGMQGWLADHSTLTLVLDDLHFADAASLELLQAVLGGPRPGESAPRWCLGLRPAHPHSPLAALMDALGTAAPAAHIALGPLTEAALLQLIDSLALPGLEGAGLAAAVRQRTGGNPLFVLETLKLLWAQGSTSATHAAAQLPRAQTLNQLIGQQLARLAPEALMLARVAAVAGVDFDLPLAEAVMQKSALLLADPWHELEQARVLQGAAFAHDLVHEAVLASLPEIIARHLHGQVAHWLEAQAGEPARVAAHWEAAGQQARALPALRAAADRAHSAHRGQERIALLLHAADIAQAAGDLDTAFECVNRAIDTHMNAIRQVSGFPLLDRLDALARTPTQKARALCQRAWYCANLHDIDASVEAGLKAQAAALPLNEPGLLALIRQRLGTAKGLQGHFEEALSLLRAAEPWVREHFAEDERNEFEGNLAILLDNLGRPDAARPHHERLLMATRANGERRHEATALGNFAVNRLNAGDVAGAAHHAHLAQDIITRYDLEGASSGFIAMLQAQCCRAVGHYAQALAWCERAQALLAKANPHWLPLVHLHLAHVWLDLAQPTRAAQALKEADPLPGRHAARREVLWVRWCQQQDQHLDVSAHLQRANELAPKHGWPEAGLLANIEYLACQNGPDTAGQLSALALEARALGLAGAALAARLRACQAATLSAPDQAAEWARQALKEAQHIEPSLMSRADIHLLCARGLRAAGQHEEALACARAGQRWLQETALAHVPAAWQSSFLERHLDHLALRAFAQL